jgi:NAD-dependent deacetylase
MELKWAAKHIADLMRESNHTVVFTGAGISTESGLPDFRSNGGLWDGKDPMKISHVDMMKKDPESLAKFYTQRIKDALAHKPNPAHTILAEWEVQGKIWGIATQNIDGYHQRAGSYNVLELHGNMDLYCSQCKHKYPYKRYLNEEYYCDGPDEEYPDEPCGGFIRPNVTMFGELLPDTPYMRGINQFSKAKLCIILGSSCSVHPANSLPQHTIMNGGDVVIVNRDKTELDHLASYIIHDTDLSITLEAINKQLQK